MRNRNNCRLGQIVKLWGLLRKRANYADTNGIIDAIVAGKCAAIIFLGR